MKNRVDYALPEAVVSLLTHNSYDPGKSDFSVTTLINSPRIVQLERRHKDKIEVDLMSRVWSMLGTGVHSAVEASACKDSTVEERFYCEIYQKTVGGQIDHYKDGVITDYKVTSAWSIVFGDAKKKWEEQLNLQSLLMQHNGFEVKELQICAILRDWDSNKAGNGGYPNHPLVVVPIELWPVEKVREFAEERVFDHVMAEGLADDDLPLCTPEECWEKPTKYAVMKDKKAKKATRLFENGEEAKEYLDKMGDKAYIVVRKGERTRCLKYCTVNKFCNQWRKYNEE